MSTKRLTSLDALRGIAALSVVFWHWQHFFALSGTWQTGWRREMQPFYWALKPLYLQGWAAVDLFFVLSGFVFFWLYSEKIAARAIGSGRFWLLRFSRLYPLHFVLLIVAAALQAIYFREVGTFFIYQDNDVGHFVANVFMVQAWWPHVPQTFDGPAWSVSIEVLLYVVFFVACRAGLRAGWPSLALAALGVPLLWFDEHIARGVMGFFMGGTAFAAWRALRAHRAAVTVTHGIGAAAVALWVLLAALLWRESSLVAGAETNWHFLLAFDLVLCPLTVLALALHESTSRRSYVRIAFLGDISYATYLLHFPMQLALVLLAVRYGLAPAFFMQGWVLVAFYAALISLGAAVYYGFERPMQDWLRGRKAVPAVVV
jgi:peptidoglycan/LPS O-acetylase OafA/YrhL